jgi:hypothetical protein
MWDQVDLLLARAPHERAVRLHRVELLEARRRRANGLDAGDLARDELTAAVRALAAVPVLARARNAWDGPLVIHKGPELALDYPRQHLRRFSDLDLLTDDARGAQAALLSAGFQAVDEAESEHHLRPLQWPGLPLTLELHTRPNWANRVPAPSTQEMLASAVPSRLGVPGIGTLAPAPHTLVLAAHAWSHDQLGYLGHLIDVAVMLGRTDEAEIAALARRWGCSRMWRTTRAAVGAVLEASGRSAAVACWGRHLHGVRDRSVLEWHVKDVLAPLWGLPYRRIPGALLAEGWATVAAIDAESWRAKLSRARLALSNAGTARSDHLLALEARGASTTIERREMG